MIQYICDICKKNIETDSDRISVEITSTENNIPVKKTYHVCKTCFDKIQTKIDKMIKIEADKRETPELDDIKRPKFYDFTQDYKNMVLRDFFSSNFYLQSQNVFLFRTRDNRIISDFEPWMSHKVLSVNPPTNAHKEVIVTLE